MIRTSEKTPITEADGSRSILVTCQGRRENTTTLGTYTSLSRWSEIREMGEEEAHCMYVNTVTLAHSAPQKIVYRGRETTQSIYGG